MWKPLRDAFAALQRRQNVFMAGPNRLDGSMWVTSMGKFMGLFEAQGRNQSQKTLDLIMAMCDDLVEQDGFQSSNSSLAKTWRDDMIWFGPAGIGATYTIERYQAQHQGPFRNGLDNIVFNGHVLEHAEGCYGGWFGWPNLIMNPGNGFMGLPASDRKTEMRVVDIYRREGEKLAENWVFIDLLNYMMRLGVDVLARSAAIRAARSKPA